MSSDATVLPDCAPLCPVRNCVHRTGHRVELWWGSCLLPNTDHQSRVNCSQDS